MAPVASPVDSTTLEPDLGPLAWVLDELRKSLDAANMALRRFVRDVELSRGSDLAALDASQLRIARQQLHQAVGALEMVGFEVPARMLRATEALVQKFVQKPEICSDDAALRVEHASFALTDYLQAVLKGRKYSSVALFPQYRDVLDLMLADRIHPADLWTHEWRWLDVPAPTSTLPLSYDSAVRTRVDSLILNVVKAGHPASALAMRDIGLGFAAHQVELAPRTFWMVSAAFFEAIGLGLFSADLYTKRAASHVLLQYRNLARGACDISEQLVRDLLFFCAKATLASGQAAPTLRLVQSVFAVGDQAQVDYEKRQFGRYDPAVLEQARKRVAAAAETWSLLSGGDVGRMKAASDQFTFVADSVIKLHADNQQFAESLTRAMAQLTRSGALPQAAVAMEIATAVLYLEAAYDDMDPDSSQTVERGNRLAQRIDHVMSGGQPEPLDAWMQELYRRVSDRQVMGSVVDELRTSLGEVEKALDTFFRHPDEKLPLQEVPGRLSQMRGVFSVLGLDQAAIGALRMRDSVERLLIDAFKDAQERSFAFEKLGNSLGSLGFLIDMLSYQREMAKKLFIYDDELGEFRSVMGVQKAPTVAPPVPEPVPGSEVASVPQAAPIDVLQPPIERAPVALIEAAAVTSPPAVADVPFDPLAPAAVAAGTASTAALSSGPEQSILPETEPLTAPEPELRTDDSIKVIGSLRIGIALYNVYLNEADEWSRCLLTELSEWSLELTGPVPEAAVALTHSLAGSSATVGFSALSEFARALEHAMEHTRLGATGQPEHAQLFVNVAEDIRRLLHQFAAGFLKEPAPDLPLALRALLEADVSKPISAQQSVAELEPVSTDVIPEPPASAVAVAGLALQEIEALDALDVDLFSVFEEEAQDLLPQLGGALRQWCARPDNLEARQEALRLLHTLKGSARLAGAMRLGEMAHRTESAVQVIDAQTAQSVEIDPLLARFDAITNCFEQLRATPLAARVLPEASASDPIEEPASSPKPTAPAKPLPFDADQKVSVWATPLASHAASPSPALSRGSGGQTIRVKSRLIDRMVEQAGEVMTSRSRLEIRLGQLRGSLDELTSSLERLRAQLRDVEIQSESQMQSRQAQAKDAAQAFDPLEFDRFTRVQELTRMMAESVHDVATLERNLQQTVAGVEDDLIVQARQTTELQRLLLRTRMVEFDSISERLFGVVRQACKDFDKQVKLEISGGALEMDRGVLDRVTGSFEHLLRNAVGHGIESAAKRQTAGKPVAGLITIHVEQQSNDVAVTFGDDGAGLDLAHIRQKAVERGQITADQILSDAEVANLIFSSGLSTAVQVSEMAGRGIGMDVVSTEVNNLGGRIELSTQPGRGTQFKLVVPLTTAVNQIVLFRIGELVMGVPASLIEQVRRMPGVDLNAAYASGQFDYNGEPLPFYWAGALLQMSSRSADAPDKTAAVGIFRSAGRYVAVHVDEVLGNQEVVVKNLGPQLARLPGLAGMSMLASGAVVLIYNMVVLSVAYGDRARVAMVNRDVADALQVPVAEATQAPLVLVVDDSVTVRRVTQRLLKRDGFRVALAADGLLALEQLQKEKPVVVLTDIEMPRMDGFDLVRNIRADAALQDLPIIMITSRIAEKHREYARELKVDHYLGKPYPEDELIALVRGYCGVAAAVA